LAEAIKKTERFDPFRMILSQIYEKKRKWKKGKKKSITPNQESICKANQVALV